MRNTLGTIGVGPSMRTSLVVLACLVSSSVLADEPPFERRLHSERAEANTFLRTDWRQQFVDSYHPSYIGDDDPATAWVEGSAGTGIGEWVRLPLEWLDDTTRVRLRIRNGNQRSNATYRAYGRAKKIAVRLLPAQAIHTFELADRNGWQQIVVDQPAGELQAVELTILDVYRGEREDLAISDVQVFATSSIPDSPRSEQARRARLVKWRAARRVAGRQYRAVADLPLYSGYAVHTSELALEGEGHSLPGVTAMVASDPVFAKDWKDALAVAKAVTANLDAVPRAQLAPRSGTRLVAVDGVQLLDAAAAARYRLEPAAFRMPMVGTVATLFADKLRLAAVRRGPTIAEFQDGDAPCRDAAWAVHETSREREGVRASAVVFGRCVRVEQRHGWRMAHVLELVVYDASGRAVLVIGEGRADGYRWTSEGGRPMIASARSFLPYLETVVEATAQR